MGKRELKALLTPVVFGVAAGGTYFLLYTIVSKIFKTEWVGYIFNSIGLLLIAFLIFNIDFKEKRK